MYNVMSMFNVGSMFNVVSTFNVVSMYNVGRSTEMERWSTYIWTLVHLRSLELI
jgi:hypothetical protein